MKEEGYISKVKRGLYRWSDSEMNNFEELIHASKIVPKGVICLLSALSYHEMTTYQPWEHYVAIHRNDTKVMLPEL